MKTCLIPCVKVIDVPAESPKILLFGYGNPGRLDDGLGPALVAKFEQNPLPGLALDANYQLTVEDAFAIAKHDVVIFADASVNGEEPFCFQELQPQPPLSFSSHSVMPGEVLALAQNLFQARTKAYVLGIRGYVFNEFGERLSEQAVFNLEAAFTFVTNFVRTGF